MKFLTFLNSGCIEICENMLMSAKKAEINLDDFHIACIDNDAYQHMKKYKNAFLYVDQETKQYQNWSFDHNSEFRKVVKHKWSIIKKVYENNKKLCWVDTDIVFKKNPLPIIQNSDKILFQCDLPGSLICSGFMVFNETERCNQLIMECGNNTTEDDQILINSIFQKYLDDIAILNLDYFPNGNYYYVQNKKENAIIVHNNHMIGIETKIQKFKEEGLWFL